MRTTSAKTEKRSRSGQTVSTAGRVPCARASSAQRFVHSIRLTRLSGSDGRPLLQHDHVEATRAQRGERDTVRPVILERVAAGRDRLHVDRRVPDAACDRGDGRGQVVRRGQAVADEEDAQVSLLRARAAGRGTREQHDEQRGERFHSAQSAASSTIVAAASPMSCTQHHSRSEW